MSFSTTSILTIADLLRSVFGALPCEPLGSIFHPALEAPKIAFYDNKRRMSTNHYTSALSKGKEVGIIASADRLRRCALNLHFST
jgi:hypothetical protein